MLAQARNDRVARLQMCNITKTFPGVVANDRVSFQLQTGEIHALLGENGAGKTTLIRILYGLYQPDAGDIVMRGRPIHIRSPRQAIALGIGLVPQHFLLVHRHTVAENIALGLAGTRFLFPVRRIGQRIRELGERYELEVDPQARIWQLSPGEQQRVEILKALLRGGEILILDEPTGLLTPQETRALFRVLARMRAEGQAVIFITHKLGEVLEIADRVTVLRKGRVVATCATADTDSTTLARMMVGRQVEFRRQQRRNVLGEAVLTVTNLRVHNDRRLLALRDVSFTVHQGEILGVTGVAGNGQRELVEVITGLRPSTAGQVCVLGGRRSVGSVRELFEAGMAHIPEERYRMGIVPTMSVAENLILRRYRYPPFARGPMLNRRAVVQFARQAITTYDIAATSVTLPAGLLSGGNIQKLILARELSDHPRLIVAAHPTYGLDVGATERIHQLLLQQREQGVAILLVSEDLDEVMRLADRIMVLCGGEVVGILPAASAEREQLGLMMAGVKAV